MLPVASDAFPDLSTLRETFKKRKFSKKLLGTLSPVIVYNHEVCLGEFWYADRTKLDNTGGVRVRV